jgi:LmbE family N-acetylglucosaminyl deacetylase
VTKTLVFAPHPDDAEFYAGGLIARLVLAGNQVKILTITDGWCGSYHHNQMDLVHIRQQEARKAAKIMGTQVEFLDYHDFTLDTLPVGELREKLIRYIRIEKPDSVITIDPEATNEAHPDHRALARAGGDAVAHAGLPLVYPEHISDGLEAHFVPEKYFYSDDPARYNHFIDITNTIESKLNGMRAHESQVEFLVEDVVKQAQLAGLDMQPLLGQAIQDPFEALRFAILAQAERVGKIAGYKYAEGYRYARFHAYVEELLAQ